MLRLKFGRLFLFLTRRAPTDLAHTLHAAANLRAHARELPQVPARDFDDAIIEAGFEVGGGRTSGAVPVEWFEAM